MIGWLILGVYLCCSLVAFFIALVMAVDDLLSDVDDKADLAMCGLLAVTCAAIWPVMLTLFLLGALVRNVAHLRRKRTL